MSNPDKIPFSVQLGIYSDIVFRLVAVVIFASIGKALMKAGKFFVDIAYRTTGSTPDGAFSENERLWQELKERNKYER